MKTALLASACWQLLVFTFAGLTLTVEPQRPAREAATPTRAERLFYLAGAVCTLSGAFGVGWAVRDEWGKE